MSRFATAALMATSASAFMPMGATSLRRLGLQQRMSTDDEGTPIFDSGSGWKPDKVEYSATDVGDFEVDVDAPEETTGFGANEVLSKPTLDGSPAMGGSSGGKSIDGLVDFSSNPDLVIAGYEPPEGLPDGMTLERPKNGIYTAEFPMKFPASGGGDTATFSIPPECQTYEPFIAGFTADSHPMFTVDPVSGTMDNRRGGEPTEFTIAAEPNGKSGQIEGCLVVVLPEENEFFHFKIVADSF